ncbi:MAG: sugar ABC transporter ATP-binding protein [Planctomycetota bacterium]
MTRPILTFERITKRFPGVTALADVSFEVTAGECHALVGENGAGKSTLGKIVAGIHRPDGGRLLLDGQPMTFRAPAEAAEVGVSMVHQELAFCPNLSVAENLVLGRMPARAGFLRRRELQRQAWAMLERVGLAIDPATPMSELSTAQEQLVQIAAAVGRRARIIIMDEPTSSLSQAESERLFGLLDGLRRAGVTVLYVSHRLEEVMRLCGRATVLRDGGHVATLETDRTDSDELVRLMIGRPVEEYFPQHVAGPRGAPLLEVERLSGPAGFQEVSFSVHAGEIVGLAGLVGAGRSEIARAVFGIDRYTTGRILVDGRTVAIRTPRQAIRAGIGLLPEDRKRQALVLSMTCKQNLTLSLLPRLTRWLLIDHRRETELARGPFERLRVRAPGLDAPVAGLSGGNQQKIALAKWLAQNCRVLILDEPTRGVDVGAKAEIHAWIDRLATEGRAILLISSELPELLKLSTRILVLVEGRMVGELPRAQADQERLLRMMARVTPTQKVSG